MAPEIMFQTARIPVLLILFGSLGMLSVPEASAQLDASREAQREQFLRMLLARQDRAIEQTLAQRLVHIETQQARVEQTVPRTPQQARFLEQLGLRLNVLASRAEQELANPPPSPLRRQLEQRRHLFSTEAQMLETRLDRLEQVIPGTPQQARQIERVMAVWQRRLGTAMGQVLFIDRVLATPYAPRDVALMPSFLTRPLAWLPAGF